MGYTFFVYLSYSNSNSIFNNLNAIMTKYRFLANKKHLILEAEPRDFLKIFLRFWPFEPQFLKNFILTKNLAFINGLPLLIEGQSNNNSALKLWKN